MTAPVHVCWPLLVGTTWRCTCQAHWWRPTTPAWPLPVNHIHGGTR